MLGVNGQRCSMTWSMGGGDQGMHTDLNSHISSWSALSVCGNVTGQPLEQYLHGNITWLATFSMARLRIFPENISISLFICTPLFSKQTRANTFMHEHTDIHINTHTHTHIHPQRHTTFKHTHTHKLIQKGSNILRRKNRPEKGH